MAEGVDYSIVASPGFITGLAAAGKRFCGRYIGPGGGPSLPGKILTAGERDLIFAAGMSIFLLAEGAADDARLGYAKGVDHATRALTQARTLGAPDSTAIYFAVDYDVASTSWAGPREYLRGAGSVIGPQRVGVYGECDVMAWAARDGVAAWFFQTYAWSAGRWFAGNHVEQYRNGVIVAGGEVDLCRRKKDNIGQWGRALGDKMTTTVRDTSDGSVWATDYISRRHVSSVDEWNMLKGLFGPTKDIPHSQLDWYGVDLAAEGPPLVITDEQLAEIEAAAKAGAEAGAPTHDELVKAAEEGANLAEDS